ncbi:MAG: aromatic acid exporter family protein [Oscillospiraceae bacterium]
MSLHPIGMRTLKTAFAVFVCLLIGRFFNPDGMIFAVIAAIVCMQRTARDSRRSGAERIIGTTIGSVVGYLVRQLSQWIPYYKEWLYMLVIPLGTMASIYLSLRVNRQTAVPMSSIVTPGTRRPMRAPVVAMRWSA